MWGPYFCMGAYTCDVVVLIKIDMVCLFGMHTYYNSNFIVLKSFVNCTDIPDPVGVRAEVAADNTSIRVSWEWSHQGVVPMCVDLVRVHYQPEGGSLMMYTVDSTTATSATLPNLQCNTKYTIWVHARGGQIDKTSITIVVSLPARGMSLTMCMCISVEFIIVHITAPHLVPPTPTEVTVQLMDASSIRVAWQWTSSGPAPNCLNTTTVTYRPEGGGESSLQLSDPAATETILTGLQYNTNYSITVVATAGEHRREGEATIVLPQQGTQIYLHTINLG